MSDRNQELQDLKDELEQQHAILVKRVTAIEADLRHTNRPVNPDWDEAAQEAENEEVLEQLEDHGRAEIQKIEIALRRFEAGVYGECVDCEEEIPIARLRAVPGAVRCVGCASARD